MRILSVVESSIKNQNKPDSAGRIVAESEGDAAAHDQRTAAAAHDHRTSTATENPRPKTSTDERGVEEHEVCQRLIQLSFEKIVSSKNERGGAKLHKNLLILHLLQKARTEHIPRDANENAAPRRNQVVAGASSSTDSSTSGTDDTELVVVDDDDQPPDALISHTLLPLLPASARSFGADDEHDESYCDDDEEGYDERERPQHPLLYGGGAEASDWPTLPIIIPVADYSRRSGSTSPPALNADLFAEHHEYYDNGPKVIVQSNAGVTLAITSAAAAGGSICYGDHAFGGGDEPTDGGGDSDDSSSSSSSSDDGLPTSPSSGDSDDIDGGDSIYRGYYATGHCVDQTSASCRLSPPAEGCTYTSLPTMVPFAPSAGGSASRTRRKRKRGVSQSNSMLDPSAHPWTATKKHCHPDTATVCSVRNNASCDGDTSKSRSVAPTEHSMSGLISVFNSVCGCEEDGGFSDGTTEDVDELDPPALFACIPTVPGSDSACTTTQFC